jgi:hypothetical protein
MCIKHGKRSVSPKRTSPLLLSLSVGNAALRRLPHFIHQPLAPSKNSCRPDNEY